LEFKRDEEAKAKKEQEELENRRARAMEWLLERKKDEDRGKLRSEERRQRNELAKKLRMEEVRKKQAQRQAQLQDGDLISQVSSFLAIT